jgi:hypothetical protein
MWIAIDLLTQTVRRGSHRNRFLCSSFLDDFRFLFVRIQAETDMGAKIHLILPGRLETAPYLIPARSGERSTPYKMTGGYRPCRRIGAEAFLSWG